jgi:Putative peptidoglycan binding domain
MASLDVGSKGPLVKILQSYLKVLNFYQGEISGTFDDNKTKEAVDRFKSDARIADEKGVDEKTWAALVERFEPILPQGDREFKQLLEQVIAAKDDAVTAKDDALKAKDDAVTAKGDALKAKDDAVTAKGDALKAKDDGIKAKDDALKAKDDALKAKDDALKAKDDAVTAKGDALKAKDDALKAKDDAVTAKGDALKAKDDGIKAKDDVIKAKDDALKAKVDQKGKMGGVQKGSRRQNNYRGNRKRYAAKETSGRENR